MKSERRHQLQQNELADQLDKAKNWLEPYLVPILIAVIAVTGVGLVYNLITAQRVSQRSEATFALLFSTAPQAGVGEDAEAYNRVVMDYPDTASAEIAQLAKADVFLGRGIQAMYSDRDEAATLLDEAVKAYQEIGDSTASTLLRSRAHFGLAQAYETQGNLKEAAEAYQQVITLNESDAMVQVAQRRKDILDSESIQSFVRWFDEQEPTTFSPSQSPSDPVLGNVPDMPDFNLPEQSPGGEAEGGATSLSDQLRNALGSGPAGQPLPENPDVQIPSGDTPPETPMPADGESPIAVPPVEGGADQPAAETTDPPAAQEPPPADSPADPPAGDDGSASPGSEPTGDEPSSEEPSSEEPTGDEPTGDEPSGDEPSGDEPSGDEPSGDEPSGDEPQPGDGSEDSGSDR